MLCSSGAFKARGSKLGQRVRAYTLLVGRYLDPQLVSIQILASGFAHSDMHFEGCGMSCSLFFKAGNSILCIPVLSCRTPPQRGITCCTPHRRVVVLLTAQNG